MNISELFRKNTAAFVLTAAVAALALPVTAGATSDEGGAGASSGASSSESGYSVIDSTPSSSELPTESMNNQQLNEDQGGAGATSGTSDSGSGYAVQDSTPAALPTEKMNNEQTNQDLGGAGTTAGSSSSSGSVLAGQIKGVIDSVDSARRKVTIRDQQGNLTSYTLKKGANVMIGERKATLASLTNGEPVLVEVAKDDPTKATAIKAGI
jgi:hypothetical protein